MIWEGVGGGKSYMLGQGMVVLNELVFIGKVSGIHILRELSYELTLFFLVRFHPRGK